MPNVVTLILLEDVEYLLIFLGFDAISPESD